MELQSNLKCRLCLGSVTSDNLIFNEEEEYEIPLSSKIMLCTSLAVSKNDDKPKYICSICVRMIEMFFEFRERCYRTHMEFCTNLETSRVSKTNDKRKWNTYRSVEEQREGTDRMVFEIETECEEVVNEENITCFEECDTSDQMSVQSKRDSFRIVENVNCVEQEKDKEMEEQTRELKEEQQQLLKDRKKETKNQDKEFDEGEKDEVDKLKDLLGNFHQFQVGCYVDLKECATNDSNDNSNDNSQSALLRRFKCMTCLKVFPSLDHLDDHWDECERSQEPECTEPLEPASQNNVDTNHKNYINFEHVEIKPEIIVQSRQSYYNKNKKHVCELCNKAFPKVVLLRKHVLKEHGYRERNFACSICPRRFIDQYELKYHMRIHSDDDGFQCKACLKKFARPSALRSHERMHTGEKPFMCNSCPKTFTQFYSLVTHERIHTGEKPYICQYCSRAFTQHSSLRKHERLHAGGAKLFQCDICRRMYADNRELELHRSTHNGELPWKCSYCEDRAFRKPSDLSKHVHRFHTESRPFQCDLCDRSFISANELKSHIVTHNSEKLFVCSACGKAYKNRLTLKRHHCKGEVVEGDLDISENFKD